MSEAWLDEGRRYSSSLCVSYDIMGWQPAIREVSNAVAAEYAAGERDDRQRVNCRGCQGRTTEVEGERGLYCSE